MADAVPFSWNGIHFAGGREFEMKLKACDLQAKGMKMKIQPVLMALVAMAGACFADTVIDFNGQSTTGNNTAFAPSVDGIHDWTDTGVTFSHEVSFGGFSWDGMTYSSVNDTATAGFGNQYAVYGDGMGMGDTGSYVIHANPYTPRSVICLLYTSDAADE